MNWQRILVAIGSNLPGPDGRTALQTCEWAARQVAKLPGLRLGGVSRWYESAPVPAADPHALLTALHGIEAAASRVRTVPNAARTLDLDLIGMDGLMLDGPLLLPHPRAAERAFVLLPLRDVAPDWRHPRLGLTAAPGVRGQAIQPLPLPGGADATN